MNTQTILPIDPAARLDHEPPAQGHSETSLAAAQAIQPDATTLRAQVIACLRRCGTYGATDEEIQAALDMNPSTQRPRRIELVRAGHVQDSGTTRPTRSGRQATVWSVL